MGVLNIMTLTPHLLASLLTISVHILGTYQVCITDGSIQPDCTQWTDPEIPYYQPHQYNCSRFWQCMSDLTPCMMECPPMSDDLGGGSLYFNTQLNVCDWPWNVDCTTTTTTTAPAEQCQARCDSYSECVAWTWNGDWSGSCYIKSSIRRKWFQLGVVSGVKICQ